MSRYQRRHFFFFYFYFSTKRYCQAKEQMNKINNNSYLNDIDEREEDWKNVRSKKKKIESIVLITIKMAL